MKWSNPTAGGITNSIHKCFGVLSDEPQHRRIMVALAQLYYITNYVHLV